MDRVNGWLEEDRGVGKMVLLESDVPVSSNENGQRIIRPARACVFDLRSRRVKSRPTIVVED
jgi:hypothetical protein